MFICAYLFVLFGCYFVCFDLLLSHIVRYDDVWVLSCLCVWSRVCVYSSLLCVAFVRWLSAYLFVVRPGFYLLCTCMHVCMYVHIYIYIYMCVCVCVRVRCCFCCVRVVVGGCVCCCLLFVLFGVVALLLLLFVVVYACVSLLCIALFV